MSARETSQTSLRYCPIRCSLLPSQSLRNPTPKLYSPPSEKNAWQGSCHRHYWNTRHRKIYPCPDAGPGVACPARAYQCRRSREREKSVRRIRLGVGKLHSRRRQGMHLRPGLPVLLTKFASCWTNSSQLSQREASFSTGTHAKSFPSDGLTSLLFSDVTTVRYGNVWKSGR